MEPHGEKKIFKAKISATAEWEWSTRHKCGPKSKVLAALFRIADIP